MARRKNLLAEWVPPPKKGPKNGPNRSYHQHGYSHTRLYWIFVHMIQRCENPKRPHYKNYGGRGITIHPAWRDDFTVFYDWAITNGYRDDLTIERKDNDGSYTPENCKWIPEAEQQSNTRANRFITAFGETKHLCAWARDPRCLVPRARIAKRLATGWPPEHAIATPPNPPGCRIRPTP